MLVGIVNGGTGLLYFFLLAIPAVALILIWYQYKGIDDYTEDYETFSEFYETRCSLRSNFFRKRQHQIVLVANSCIWFLTAGLLGVAVFFVWYYFKIDNDEEYETLTDFYKTRLSRIFCCCYRDTKRRRRGSIMEMTAPLLEGNSDSQQ